MPKRPRKPCAFSFCPALVESGQRYCDEHRKAEQRKQDEARGSAADRGYDHRWGAYARGYKRRHPLCMECKRQGRITAVYCVDHIEPVESKYDPKFWDETNHQSLCESCHNRKTAKEKRFGRG